MGGFGSGKSYKGGRKTNKRCRLMVSWLPCLDISKLMSLYKRGQGNQYVWRDTISLTVESDQIRLVGAIKETIKLVPVPCHYGGFRYSVHCPVCNTRVTKLYLCKDVLGCRHCLKLNYWNQSETKYGQLVMKRSALGKRINEGLEKPKWMRWPTYERLCVEYRELDEKIQLADFFSLRNNRQINRILEEYGGAVFAAEEFMDGFYSGEYTNFSKYQLP